LPTCLGEALKMAASAISQTDASGCGRQEFRSLLELV
jgi:hypothetical protein